RELFPVGQAACLSGGDPGQAGSLSYGKSVPATGSGAYTDFMSAPTDSPLAVPLQPVAPLAGVLHVYVAFDWGDEVRLESARSLVPAEVHALPRRRRTPPSIAYRPAPLRFLLEPVPLSLPELGTVQLGAEA